MKKVYEIKKDILFLVENSIEQYDSIIKKRMLMFDELEDKKNIKNYIKIFENKTIYNINNKKHEIFGKLKHTDLYQLINNLLSNLINDDNNLYIHSVVLGYQNKGILLLGDFGSGKTYLSIEARKEGFDILSADQSWLIKKEKDIYLYKGSRYLKIDNESEIISENKILKIDTIITLKGACGFETRINMQESSYRNIKDITKYATWSSSNILMTDNYELTLDKVKINNFLKDIDIKNFYVFGKIDDIIKFMKDVLK